MSPGDSPYPSPTSISFRSDPDAFSPSERVRLILYVARLRISET